MDHRRRGGRYPRSTSVDGTYADKADRPNEGLHHTEIGQSEYEVNMSTDDAMVIQGNQGDSGTRDTSHISTKSSRYRIGTAGGHSLVVQGNTSQDAWVALLQERAASLNQQRQAARPPQQEKPSMSTSTRAPGGQRLLDHRDTSPARFKIVDGPIRTQGQVVIEVEELEE